jgi:hypothetical protein
MTKRAILLSLLASLEVRGAQAKLAAILVRRAPESHLGSLARVVGSLLRAERRLRRV